MASRVLWMIARLTTLLFGPTPVVAAIARRIRLRRMALVAFVVVAGLSPASLTFAQGTWTSLGGPVGGFVRVLTVDPVTPTTVYAGTPFSGVFRSTNRGASWTRSLVGFSAYPYDPALAVDPVTPTTVYAGIDAAVYKSTDGGVSWTSVFVGASVIRTLVVDPVTPTTVYAAGGFLYKSTDGGGNWTAAFNNLTGAVSVVVIDPVVPSTLYVETSNGAFRTTDGGASWTLIPINFLTLAIDPVTHATLYSGYTYASIFKSTDSSATWTQMNDGLCGDQVRAIVINPVTPTTLYAGVIGGGVCRSDDGGASWTSISDGLTNVDVKALALDPVTHTTLYAGTLGSGVWVLH
jgi:photosystem II stability/assembly factor-like uncharacterized protein